MRRSIVPLQRDLFAGESALPSATVLQNSEDAVQLLADLLWQIASRLYGQSYSAGEVEREQD